MRDMPKLESPFYREEINGKYVCVPKINDDYRWVFTDKAIATEKLDGTNVSIIKVDGAIKIFNRTNYIDIWNSGGERFYNGIMNAFNRGYINPHIIPEGKQVFGELIGEKIQGDPYGIKGWLWIPLEKLIASYAYRFWNTDIIPLLQNKSDTEIFHMVSDYMAILWSLMKRKYNPSLNHAVDKTITFSNNSYAAAEGIVFYHKEHLNEIPSDAWMCKLRRDMFDWYQGKEH